MGAPLIRTRMVLTFVPDAGVPMYEDDDPDSERTTTVVLDEGVWHDMMKPETITVTVEVGDTLNPEARREAWQADTSASGTFKCPDAGPELCGPSSNEA